MRKTYAYNGIIIGALLGLLAWATTENTAIGVVAAIGGSVACFLIIRAFENLVSKGIDKAGAAITQKLDEAHKNK